MNRIVFYCTCVLLLVLETTRMAWAQPPTIAQREASMLVDLLQKTNIAPRTINDAFGKDVFDQLIKSTDPEHMYFSAKEIVALQKMSSQIDDDIRLKKSSFITEFAKIYNKRLLQTEILVKALLEQPLKFSSTEKINSLVKDSASFATDENAWNYKWRQWLKYKMLWHWVAELDEAGQKNDLNENDFLKSESVFRNKVKIIEQRKIRRVLDNDIGFEKFISNVYLQSIAACYDPHTNYMSKTDYENFESAITTEALSLGLDLQEEENGEISIARLVPGGPAWKSNELNKGDKLVEISWQGKAAVDLAGVDIEEVEELINTSNTIAIVLKIRKINGVTKIVTLAKEKLREDENIVKSFVINGAKKIGYIYLPGFYTELENTNAKGCSNDVAKEIVKLKAEKIQGLILDIRNNGGGSLSEGLSLSGIFINEGPLFMMQVSHQKLQVMKDPNRGTIYDGPMVVMINGYSASASELVASTLQDYHRAILVGSRTYGKATGQVVLPIDTTIGSLTNFKSPYGLVKVTMDKLFRITGKSAQLMGVQPDILLPDAYEALNQYESQNDFALSRDTVSKKVMYTPLSPLPLKLLVEKSEQRVKQDSTFNKIIYSNTHNPLLAKNVFQNIPLSPILFKKKILEIYTWYRALENIEDSNASNNTISKTQFDIPISNMSKDVQEMENIIIKNMLKDKHLSESCAILNDYINLISK